MLYARIPSDRLGVLIGPEGATKKRLQESTGTRIAVDSATGDVTIDETAAADPVLALNARDVLHAIAREAVFMLLRGSEHRTVYRFLERKRADLKVYQMGF